MPRRNKIIYVPEVLRKALDHYAKLHGVRLVAILHALTPFVELAAENAAAKAGAAPQLRPEPELPPMVKAAEVREAS